MKYIYSTLFLLIFSTSIIAQNIAGSVTDESGDVLIPINSIDVERIEVVFDRKK